MGTAINVIVQGQRHLGAAIGSREYVEEYVNGQGDQSDKRDKQVS